MTTVEGLASDGQLHPLQQAFLDSGAAQCGFCIPGQLMSAQALLALTPHPTRAAVEEGLAGNCAVAPATSRSSRRSSRGRWGCRGKTVDAASPPATADRRP